MAELYDIMKEQSKYWDKKNYTSLEAYNAALEMSATVYVGNLSFYTQQNAIKELFSRAGNVKDIIMGIDNEGNPCGFCFVIYETKRQAELAVQYISKTRLGGRIIRVDLDPGFMEGREKGRGSSGQQRRDDFRSKEDPERPRKKVITGNYQSGGRDSYRGGYKDRGQGGYRERREGGYRGGRDDNQREQHRGERRDNRYRDNRGGNNFGGQQRGERRDYRENREQRQQKEYKQVQQPQKSTTNNNNKEAEDY